MKLEDTYLSGVDGLDMAPLIFFLATNMQTEEITPRSRRNLVSVILWILVILLIVSIFVIRQMVSNVDFAFANILTVGLSLLTWSIAVIALFTSRAHLAIWCLVLWIPVLAATTFFVLFKFERLDGELRPQFRLRSQADIELPTARDDMAASAGMAPMFVASRSTDFSQFLGPNRNATINDITLDSNWDLNPPEIAWKQEIGDGWSGFAVQGDLAITMEQREQQEWVTAYSVIDGKLIWNYEIDALHTNVLGGPGPRSTPTIAGGRVFACSAVSKVVCLDLITGAAIWSHDLLELANATQTEMEESVSWGRSGSPLVLDQTVVVPFGGAASKAETMIAFDTATGEERWRTGKDQISYSSPAFTQLAGVDQILLVSEKQLGAYLPDSGEQIWSYPWEGNSNGDASVSQPVVLLGDKLLMTKGYGTGAQLLHLSFDQGQWNTEVVWKNARVLKTKFTSCVVRDGYAYGLSDGILECVDLKAGKRMWKRGRYRQGQLLLVGQYLLISSERGEVVLVAADPDKFQELAKLQVIGNVTWNTLTLSGNRLLIRNSDESACIILPTVNIGKKLER